MTDLLHKIQGRTVGRFDAILHPLEFVVFPQHYLKEKSWEVQGQMLVMSERLALSVLWQTQPYSWAGSLVSRGCKSTLMHTVTHTHTYRFARKVENGLLWSAAVWANDFHRSNHTQVACLLHYTLPAALVPNLHLFSFLSLSLISHLFGLPRLTALIRLNHSFSLLIVTDLG